MKKTDHSRRKFLQQSAMAAAAITIIPRHVLGGRGYIAPSDLLNIGFIGTGKLVHGYFENFAALPEVHIMAACDVYQEKLSKFKQAVDEYYSEKTGKPNYSDCKVFSDYHELLGLDEIDAVIVATPDHWHAIPSIDAMKAGKDVYCEKPLAHTIKEGREMVEAASKYERVVQTGSMQRSNRDFRHACELVRNGYVGEISQVIVDWDRWIGPAQIRPFHEDLAPPHGAEPWPMWRRYREFGGGILADWGAHMFDIAQWGLGMDESGPVKFIPPEDPAATRGMKMIYANSVEMIHEDFDRGWAVRFIGSEGVLDVSRSFLDSKPAHIATAEIKSSDNRLYHSDNHYQDWVDAIKKRSVPVTGVETGHRSASVCNLANIAYKLNRTLEWDPVKEKFKGDGEANKLRTKKYRKPHTL
ncbi:MAG: oxidoreductase [Bacteroides sp. SM23_62]|nr:MAG: oxidoreductase [Bacteroides sp. SM23_62]